MLDILIYHLSVHFFIQCFIYLHQPGKIFPASGSGKNPAVYCVLHSVKILSAKLQIRDYSGMDSLLIGIFFPYFKIRLHINSLDSVKGYYVKFADRFIVFRRVSCCHDHPSLRYFLIAKSLSLKELQHHRCQGFRYAVDLINKKNPLFQPCLLHLLIDRGNNLTHSIFCDRKSLLTKGFLSDKRQSYCTLTGVMCDGIRYQSYLTFSGDLFHDLCFSNTRCPHKKNRSLAYGRDQIFSKFILRKVCFY